MYVKHFGLTRRPFAATTDAPSYYPATAHERALRLLTEALHEQESFAVLTGEAGTGKTLVAHRLIERMGDSRQASWLANTHLPDLPAFLQALLYDLDQPYQGLSEQELRLRLTDHLLRQFQDGRPVLLVIDEAHHLTLAMLEELRLLGNLEARPGKALQVVLVGPPGLLHTLRHTALAGLWQRIGTRVHLPPLDVHEAADYLLHHLRAAGGRPERLITEEGLEALARGTGGVPRLLNQAAHRAFQLAAEAGQPCVDAEAALEALAELELTAATPPPGEELSEDADAAAGCNLKPAA
jgi:type II secretory pathway predicted ATPase ExeA